MKSWKKLWGVVLLVTLALCLSGCQAGIIGGADGPTSIIVSNGEVSVPDPDAEPVDSPEAVDADAEAAPEEPPVTLTLALLSGPWAEAIREGLPTFEEGNGVICEVREFSREELYDALTPSGDGEPFDLVMVHSSNMPEFTQSGALASLSAFGYKPDSDFIPSVMEICHSGSAYYLAPWYGNATVLLCNKEALLAADSSVDRIQNLQNMLSVCTAAKKRGQSGFLYHRSHENLITMDFLPVLRSFDGWIVDRDGKPTIYTKKFQDAVNFFMELARTGKAVSDADFRSTIDSGAAAMGFIRSDAYAPSAASASTYLSFPGASERGGETHNAGICTIWGLGIPAGSANPELAERLLEYLINPNIQKSTLSAGVTPCRYSILQDPDVQKEYPYFGKVCAALEHSQYAPPLTQWAKMCDILGEEMGKMMAGSKRVTEGLSDAQRRIEALLAA